VAAFRGALERLLGDPGLRNRLGRAAGERAREYLSWERSTALTIAAYDDALRPAVVDG
jgi:glycosyltransferase involved in cell wall biosynthesis